MQSVRSLSCFDFGSLGNKLETMSTGFPGDSDGKESACSAGNLGGEDPLEEGMATHSSIAWRIP